MHPIRSISDAEFALIFQVRILLCFLVSCHILDGISNSAYTAWSEKLGSEHCVRRLCVPFCIVNLPEVGNFDIGNPGVPILALSLYQAV
jgi:hypothetical protein